jgi:hypothetical protein
LHFQLADSHSRYADATDIHGSHSGRGFPDMPLIYERSAERTTCRYQIIVPATGVTDRFGRLQMKALLVQASFMVHAMQGPTNEKERGLPGAKG